MPARPETVSSLYLDTCLLANTETQLGISPRPPFEVGHRPRLRAQAEEVANEARRLRGLDQTSLDTAKVRAARTAVAAAQKLLDAVNEFNNPPTDPETIFKAIDAAIMALKALP
jgi:hypothetical protein